MSDFMKNGDGVHLMSPCNSEFSICGDAFDIGSEEGLNDMKPTSENIVSCKKCQEVINICHIYSCG